MSDQANIQYGNVGNREAAVDWPERPDPWRGPVTVLKDTPCHLAAYADASSAAMCAAVLAQLGFTSSSSGG